jgi:hypothetical protein
LYWVTVTLQSFGKTLPSPANRADNQLVLDESRPEAAARAGHIYALPEVDVSHS